MVGPGSVTTCVARATTPSQTRVLPQPALTRCLLPFPGLLPPPSYAPPPPPTAGSADQFNAAQLNSVIANQQQVNSNSGANFDTVLAAQGNAAVVASNKGELRPGHEAWLTLLSP